MDLKFLSNRFKAFAEKECKGSSPLYEQLSKEIAGDPELLELSSHARKGQPVPNLLFGAVHYLLLKGANHQLGGFYASIEQAPRPVEAAFTHFKHFCLQNRTQIIELLETRLVQTNEVRRCAYLFPLFNYIHELAARPLALIEIGTSAGFQLLWDHYSYTYGDGIVYGSKGAEVKIHAGVKGDVQPVFNKPIAPVTDRYGLDLQINDVTKDEDSQWMKALIWPEHRDRRELFEEAVQCMKANRGKISFIEGDGVEILPELIGRIPRGSAIVMFHTHVANQMPPEAKLKLLENIERIAKSRDVFHLYNNMDDGNLHLDSFIGGQKRHQLAAITDGHGRWFEWKLESAAEAGKN
ncbi:DUF2332 domain-containing protein [Neobacillus piezotolerans]|uniref:DUF2332 domain-containing protein n=1 Tax=Neobacillus piezotolerans TaxID=2259171 RepID=A0A3D8GKW7_9BACI|nr:DUF2332 domain-containing protein [Neobacillus piezotolerans]RDU34971.1 DUF2332 domain-containing protein [Neobacillus piezotolerans]